MRHVITACLLCSFFILKGQTPDADPQGWPHNNMTPTWEEGVAAFKALADADDRARWMEIGRADCGQPIHALVLQTDPLNMPGIPGVIAARESRPDRLRILINNAIHPGEPCGVDASLALARELLGRPVVPEDGGRFEPDAVAAGIWPTSSQRSWYGAPEDWSAATIAIIPFYNVGGARNRNCCSRANQNGPLAYGFRGNARNFDLNRDFIKMDTENAAAFARFFTAFDPDVFIDTHTTNGADYPYTMTCITTQQDKVGGPVGSYLRDRWDPVFYAQMEAAGYPMSPYVYAHRQVPDSGLVGFLETPRYSTGYAALWGTLGFTAEAHMLKPFPERVQAMLNFLQRALVLGLDERETIQSVRLEQTRYVQTADSLPIRWARDETRFTPLEFTGYTARYEPSALTGADRLRYDQQAPWTRSIPFYNQFDVERWARVPEHYIIPAGWSDVANKLRANGVAMHQVEEPRSVAVEITELVTFSSGGTAYEGHHFNRVDSLVRRAVEVLLLPGDWVVPTDQRARRYVVEALEVEAHDSFWAWGAFDSALQRKEGFSAYVFEDTAEALLARDAALAEAFDLAQNQHPEWASDPSAALRWIYEHSPYAESTAGRYPVMKSIP